MTDPELQLRELVNEGLAACTEQQRLVFRAIHGLDAGIDSRKAVDVADDLGISKQQVSIQLQAARSAVYMHVAYRLVERNAYLERELEGYELNLIEHDEWNDTVDRNADTDHPWYLARRRDAGYCSLGEGSERAIAAERGAHTEDGRRTARVRVHEEYAS